MSKEELTNSKALWSRFCPTRVIAFQLDAGYEVVAYTAGKMKKNRIKTLVGNRVTIEMSPSDLKKGRLIFRHKS